MLNSLYCCTCNTRKSSRGNLSSHFPPLVWYGMIWYDMQTATFTRSHQCGSSSRFHKFMYSCEIFVFSRTYLFVRALLAITRSTPTQEGRPEPMVEVWARSEHWSPRGVRSKFFFRWQSIRWFPGVSVQRFFIFNVHTRTILFFFAARSWHRDNHSSNSSAQSIL